jgi:hypothetical protein
MEVVIIILMSSVFLYVLYNIIKSFKKTKPVNTNGTSGGSGGGTTIIDTEKDVDSDDAESVETFKN